jgi:hypothetical protein
MKETKLYYATSVMSQCTSLVMVFWLFQMVHGICSRYYKLLCIIYAFRSGFVKFAQLVVIRLKLSVHSAQTLAGPTKV